MSVMYSCGGTGAFGVVEHRNEESRRRALAVLLERCGERHLGAANLELLPLDNLLCRI